MRDARLLLVEDDDVIGRSLTRALQVQHLDVRWCTTGTEALGAASVDDDIALIDLGLPDIDGLDVCKQLRERFPDIGLVIITARNSEVDVVVGLDAGADDFIAKPFRLAELLARIRATLRRVPAETAHDVLQAGQLVVDLSGRRVLLGQRELALRPKEFDLLALLVAESGRAVSRERIMAAVWDQHWSGSTKTLDIHIANLRKKIDDPKATTSTITTLRGIGYRLDPP